MYFELCGKGEAADGESTAKVVVAGESESTTVFSVTDGSTGWTTKEVDLSAFAGEDATVNVIAEGDATVEVDSISVTHDDGDDIPHHVEKQSNKFAVPVIRTVDGEQTFQMRYLDLDPYSADTDGDGLKDGIEVSFNTRPLGGEQGEESDRKVIQSVESYYSHPNLVNTDGMGLDDKTERKKGSDPIVPERLAVGFRLATVGEKTNDVPDQWKPKDAGTHNNAYKLGLSDVYNPSMIEGEKPQWLKGQNIDVDNSKKYLLVRGYVFVNREGNPDADYVLPSGARFTLKGGRTPAEIVGWTKNEIIEQGVVSVNIIIEVPDGTTQGNIGRFEFGMYTDKDSPFYRIDHSDSERRDAGAFTTVTTDRTYTFQDYGQYDMERVTRESMEKFKKGIMTTMTVYRTTYGLVLTAKMGNSVAKKAVKTVAKEVSKEIVKSKAKGTVRTYVGGRRTRDSYERNDAQKVTTNAGVIERPKWFVHTGVMIVREN